METYSEVIHENDFLVCELQELDDKMWLHVKVLRKTKASDVKQAREDFKWIKEFVASLGFDELYAATPSPHFARLFGAGFDIIHTLNINGSSVEVIVWDLKS